MPLEGDRFIMANLAAFSIQQFAGSLGNISKVPIRGLNRFVNDVKNGKRLGDQVEKFYENVLRSVSSITEENCPDLGVRIAESLARSIGMARQYFSMISTDNPFGYHNDHLIAPDVNAMAGFFTDVTSSYRRIMELMQLDNKALSLPALKDQYILSFESAYKPLYGMLYKLLDDGTVGEKVLHKRVEDILCLSRCYGPSNKVRSDVRVIRNLFAHPDRIDCYDHYRITLENGILELHPNDLMILNDCLVHKLMLLTFLSGVMLDLELYHRVFEA